MRTGLFLASVWALGCTGGPGSSTGEAGGACYPNATCNAGLVCDVGTCIVPTPNVDGGRAGDAGATTDGGRGNDAAGVVCNDDSELEPNDATSEATRTGIPNIQTSVDFVGLAICPAGDRDVFRFDIAVNGTTARARIGHDSQNGELEVRLLNAAGDVIAVGSPLEGDADVVVAVLPNLPLGTYYAEVRATEPSTLNNYNVRITTLQ